MPIRRMTHRIRTDSRCGSVHHATCSGASRATGFVTDCIRGREPMRYPPPPITTGRPVLRGSVMKKSTGMQTAIDIASSWKSAI